MHIAGLHGIPWLESLAASRLPSAAGAALLLAIAMGAGALIDLVPLERSAWGVELGWPVPVYWRLATFLGLLLAAVFLLARAATRDLHAGLEPAEVPKIVARHRISRNMLIASFVICTLWCQAGFFALYYLGAADAGVQLSAATVLSVPWRAGGAAMLFHAVMLPASGLVGAICLAVVWQLFRVGMDAACTLPVSLLRTTEYAWIANNLVRLFMASMVLLTFFPALYVAVNLLLGAVLFSNVTILALGIPACALLFRPVVRLRNRIRDLRDARMREIVTELETSGPDPALLMELMYLESRSDWPIAQHFRRLVLFGLLPPLGWVLAAVVENLLY